MTRRFAAGVALAAVIFAPSAAAQSRFPQFSNYVVDAVGVVPDDVEQQINAQLADFERRTTSQVAVAVIGSTGNDSLEDYTIDLARYWGVGRKGDDNGVLLLIAYEDRRIRIEVGEKVEDELTDLESGRIINDYMVPLMREGNVGEAVQTGANEIRRALGDTEVGEAPPPPTSEPEGYDVPAWALFVPFLIFGPLGRFFSRRSRRRSGWITPVFWGGWGGLGGGFGGRQSGGSGGGGFGGGGGGSFGGGGASGGW